MLTAVAAIRMAVMFQPAAAKLVAASRPCVAALAITSAMAPPGGWMQRNQPIRPTEIATARPKAR